MALKRDLNVIFGREEVSCTLYAVDRTDQMVHFKVEFRAISMMNPSIRSTL